MLASCPLIKSNPTPNTPPIQATYQHVEAQLELHEYFNFLLKQEPFKLNEQKTIQPRMRSKLFGWLEKLALQTFHFSHTTLLTAANIIDQYLEKTNEAPSSLQLIGCTGLFIASKLRQEVIVDPECYSTASCKVFNKRHLIEKERIMYGYIDWKKLKAGASSGLKIGCSILNMRDHLQRCDKILWNCAKDEELTWWRDVKLVYGVISCAIIDPHHDMTMKDCLNLIKHI